MPVVCRLQDYHDIGPYQMRCSHGVKLGNLTALLDKLQPVVMDEEVAGKSGSDIFQILNLWKISHA